MFVTFEIDCKPGLAPCVHLASQKLRADQPRPEVEVAALQDQLCLQQDQDCPDHYLTEIEDEELVTHGCALWRRVKIGSADSKECYFLRPFHGSLCLFWLFDCLGFISLEDKTELRMNTLIIQCWYIFFFLFQSIAPRISMLLEDPFGRLWKNPWSRKA